MKQEFKHRIVLRTDRHRDRAVSLAGQAPLGHEVIIQRHKDPKTLSQVRYTFGVIYPTILKFIEQGYGESFSVEDLHKYLKGKILGYEYKSIAGEVLEVEKHLSRSDKDEWSDYIDRLISYAYNNWGLVVPPPYYRENAA